MTFEINQVVLLIFLDYVCIMKKLIFSTIDKFTKGVDTYNNNGNVWLIFTDEKKWVIELTKEGTLWYNYYFFQDILKYFSLDVVENQHYITEWVEDNIISQVKRTVPESIADSFAIEDTIQNGVIYTVADESAQHLEVGDTIQNGVKYTKKVVVRQLAFVDDTIQNGVKETFLVEGTRIGIVENTIQNGIKETKQEEHHRLREVVQTVKNGVKETNWRG